MPATKAIFERFAVTDSGDVIPGAEYTVVNELTGTNLTIYSSREGASKSPPYFADSSGLMQFYVNAGTTFRVVVTGPTGTFTSRYNQGLLLIESPIDTTNGRVMTTGAGGLNSTQAPRTANKNPDDTLVIGFYHGRAGLNSDADSGDNPFPTFGGGYYLTVVADTTGRIVQYAAVDSGTSPAIKFRVRAGGTWYGWQELYHTGNLNTLEFGGSGANSLIGFGGVANSTIAQIYLPINLSSAPSSISVAGTFALQTIGGAVIQSGIGSGSISISASARSPRWCVLNVTSSGLTINDTLKLVAESTSSKITVNP